MRVVTVVLMTTLAAAPALASGHGHSSAKPASETTRAKTSDGEKTFHEKKSHYEKKLQATERESDQTKSLKLKGLTHAPFEPGDLADTGKEARKADLREPPPSKLKGGGAPGVAPPSVRGSTAGGASAGGH
jgi:hypothetical protein